MVDRRFWGLIIAALTLAACATPVHPLPQPAEGYDAIRFRRTVQVRDHLVNIYTFAAGSTFIADRATDFGVVYCGQAQINDGLHMEAVCFGVEPPSTLVIGPGGGFKEVRRPQADGTFEINKMKL